MAVDKSVIGQCTGKWRVVVERGPVSNFAKAVKDNDPIYHDATAAKAAGFENIPAPPTWAFAMNNWGTFAEDQPEDNPAVPGGTSPVMKIMGGLMSKGGMILHGEQEFTYYKPLVVGDVLVGEGTVVDLYEKESKGKTMTFLVTENAFKDEKTGEPVVTARMNLIHRA